MAYYTPYETPWIGRVETVEDFIEAIKTTLQYWYDIHFYPEAWASSWVIDEDIRYIFEESEGEVGNRYFHFNWKQAVFRVYARKNRKNFSRCNKCWRMHEVGCEDECCSEKGRKLVQPTIAQIEEWLGEVFYDVKDLPSDLHDQDLFEALRDEGFKVYRKALANLTDPIGREIKAALNQIDQANTPEEKVDRRTLGQSHPARPRRYYARLGRKNRLRLGRF